MNEDQIHYQTLIDQAMRGVVRDVLKRVQATGLPGEHHFYISYATTHPGVKMSEQLKARYPKEITIVLQHQFWDFKVEEQQFHVTLSFSGMPEKLTVPFSALTAFADPSIKFGLQLQPPELSGPAAANADGPQELLMQMDALPVEQLATGGGAAAEIISLDAFRNKK